MRQCSAGRRYACGHTVTGTWSLATRAQVGRRNGWPAYVLDHAGDYSRAQASILADRPHKHTHAYTVEHRWGYRLEPPRLRCRRHSTSNRPKNTSSFLNRLSCRCSPCSSARPLEGAPASAACHTLVSGPWLEYAASAASAPPSLPRKHPEEPAARLATFLHAVPCAAPCRWPAFPSMACELGLILLPPSLPLAAAHDSPLSLALMFTPRLALSLR